MKYAVKCRGYEVPASGRSPPVATGSYGQVVLKNSASVSTAQKYAYEIEVCVLRRRFRAQI